MGEHQWPVVSHCAPLRRAWRSAAFLQRAGQVVRCPSGAAAGGGRQPFRRRKRRRSIIGKCGR